MLEAPHHPSATKCFGAKVQIACRKHRLWKSLLSIRQKPQRTHSSCERIRTVLHLLFVAVRFSCSHRYILESNNLFISRRRIVRSGMGTRPECGGDTLPLV